MERPAAASFRLAIAVLATLVAFGAGNAAEAPLPRGENVRTFRDCPECPEMRVIPGGTFAMGSSAAEKTWAANNGSNAESVADEAPQHDVSLESFAIGTDAVTRAQYAAFVRETGYPAGDGCGVDSFKWNKRKELDWQHPGFAQSDSDPVVCVSWNDAHAYLDWLNRKLQQHAPGTRSAAYRLPSESEWEYAARAGATSRFWWGDDAGSAAEHAWFKENSAGRTHAVGSKPANRFGLHDAVGNVWQWTEDCYADSYASAPSDGKPAPETHDCMRVDRGGCWQYPAWLLRSATRERNPPSYRDAIMGFRVAKSLP